MEVETPDRVEPCLTETVLHRGCRVGTAFQAIVSLSHRRTVGHEALLRATAADGSVVPPLTLLQAPGSEAARRDLDRLSLALHVRNFARQRCGVQWLFVNVGPAAFLHGWREADQGMPALLRGTGLEPSQLVLEVTEEAVADSCGFEEAATAAHAAGFLLALDDFGAGHSNFDRVWRMQPDIVKLDRSLAQRGAANARVARVLRGMVSMLHQCGALVLMEGIETEAEAGLALDCDVDLVQGYLFGRPAARLQADLGPSAAMLDTWAGFEARAQEAGRARRARITPYVEALRVAATRLARGEALAAAATPFLVQDGVDVCFLLDEQGIQHGQAVAASLGVASQRQQRFAPLLEGRQACWARRPYFRRAIEEPGQVQVTRPYLSLRGARLCLTLSVGVRLQGRPYVLCGDVAWD